MSHLSVHALLNHAVAPAAAAPLAGDAQGFEALLGQMAQPKGASAGPATAKDTKASPDTPTPASADAGALAVLQSLEASLSNLASLSAPASPSATAPLPGAASAPLGAALGEAAGALVGAGAKPTLKAMLEADPTLGLKDVQMKTFLGVAGAIPARSGATPLTPDGAWSPTEAMPAKTNLANAAAATAGVQTSPSVTADLASPPAAANPKVSASTAQVAEPAAQVAAPAVQVAAPAIQVAAPAVQIAAPAVQVSAPAILVSAPATPPPAASTLATQSPDAMATPLPAASPARVLAASASASPFATVAAVETPAPAVAATPPASPTPARKAGGESRSAVSQTSPAAVSPVASSQTATVATSGSDSAHNGANPGGGDAAAAAPAAAVSADAAASPSATITLAQLPAFLADQASSLTAEAPDAPNAASAPTPAAARTAQAVKELKISLDPANLGEMTVRLKLANGKLSVSISVANPTTLGAIEDDRALIAARLGAGDQTLEDLVISRQAPPTEVSSSNASQDSGSSDDSDSDPDPPSPRPGARRASGGGFSGFLV